MGLFRCSIIDRRPTTVKRKDVCMHVSIGTARSTSLASLNSFLLCPASLTLLRLLFLIKEQKEDQQFQPPSFICRLLYI